MSKKKSKNKKGGAASKKSANTQFTSVSENRKARHRYEILESMECGMMLMGSEVKSMREGKLSLDEAYIRVKDKELWLIGSDISHYKNAGMWNHLTPEDPESYWCIGESLTSSLVEPMNVA